MVSATRWRQDQRLAPNNPNQRVRFRNTFPGGVSAFGWSPQPFEGMFKFVGSPAGHMSSPGLSGLRAPLVPGWSGIAKVIGAVAGVAAGAWLAHKNLGG